MACLQSVRWMLVAIGKYRLQLVVVIEMKSSILAAVAVVVVVVVVSVPVALVQCQKESSLAPIHLETR